MNFAMALQFYRRLLPERIPRRILVFTVDIHPTLTFEEGMSTPVGVAASRLAESIARQIEQGPQDGQKNSLHRSHTSGKWC